MTDNAMREAYYQYDNQEEGFSCGNSFGAGWKACHAHLLERLRSEDAWECALNELRNIDPANFKVSMAEGCTHVAVKALIAMLGGKEG